VEVVMARPGDSFFKQTECARCGDELTSQIMSKFNHDVICLSCKADERLAPGYGNADTTEVAAVRAGDYNFPGVGLTPADQVFLAGRVAARPGRNSKGAEASEVEHA
jgi:ribosomal protein S27E